MIHGEMKVSEKFSKLLVLLIFVLPAFAEEAKLSEIVVEAESEENTEIAEQAMEVDSAKILSGKKTTVTELKKLPKITTNNYRQAFSQTPGLFTSEVSNESFTSFNYRGLGDPHESFNLNILKDGVPIAADPFGYPAAYYQPPVDAVEKLEFIRGGASLLYGPQIGGALNYVTKDPLPNAPLSVQTKQVFGQKNLYQTHNEVSGSQDGIDYLGFFNHRQSDGFRDNNSDYAINNGNVKLKFDSSKKTHWEVSLDAYGADHGEAGGLAITSGEGLANYYDNRNQTTTEHDRLRIERYASTASVKYDVDSDTRLYSTAFGGYYRRNSRRQSAGDAPSFGGIKNGESNDIVTQEFKNIGLDSRVEQDWKLGEDKHTLAAGLFLFGSDSPYSKEKGASVSANSGELQRDIDRKTYDAAFFAENRFVFGRLKITPGLRFENIYQEIDENFNSSGDALRDESDYQGVLIPGIGAAYDVGLDSEVYANISTSYKPKTYEDTIPLNSGDTISGDLDAARGQLYEAGLRGKPLAWLSYDTSLFHIIYDDQFGRVGTNIQNVGKSETNGFDAAAQIGTFKLLDELADTKLSKYAGELSLYANASILDAEFTSGPVDGKTPQYAPDYLIRTGLIYNYFNVTKLAFLGTLVDDHFADDGNSTERFIPSYSVWDLTFETGLWKDKLSLVAGVNNIFDKEYFARIRSNGVDPALPRNIYAGLNYKF